jgi:Raf kinase inhibitor-like YbhB/YbcL family protein
MNKWIRTGIVALSLSIGAWSAWSMEISSPDFDANNKIPSKFTCDGANISPALAWTDPPSRTASFALIVDDSDAPRGIWTHWIVFDMPPGTRSLAASIPSGKKLENGLVQGLNDFGVNGYGGPCPPSGTHRYFFRLYALDKKLTLDPKAKRADVLKAMEKHILDKRELIGLYGRSEQQH